MEKGRLQIYFGSGKGKTTAAVGQAIRAASKGKSVFIVQFLKGRQQDEELSFIQRLEPEIKLFRFQRQEKAFLDLTPEQRAEEIMNMQNGLQFARKVLATMECDMLILDEIMGLVEHGIVKPDELADLMKEVAEGTEVVFTGIKIFPELMELADEVYEIKALKG